MNTSTRSLSPAGQHQILVEWNEPPDYPRGGLLPDLVAEQVARRPDAVAVVAGEQRVLYRDLAARAGCLAAGLRRRGVGPEVIVGLLLERSPDVVAVILALWQCGAAYLPLDPELPADRMAWLLADGLRGPGPRLVVTQRELASRIPAAEAGVDLAPVEDLGSAGDEGGAGLPLQPGNVAYVIYTSGSTGRPKGIMISHGSLANRILWARGTEFGPDNAYLQKTSPTFDISLSETWTPLASGGRCVLVRPGGQRDPLELAELIHRERITHASFPPPLLRLLLEVPGAAEKLRSLRVLITGGETVPPDLPRLALRLLPATRVYNRYGPTETTISCMSGACRPEGHGETVPIGRGTARTRVYVLDEELQPLPPLEAGEIYLGGPGVARGYLGRPDLTAERFVPDPFAGAGARLYRTGDRARWRPEGSVDFLGRVDYQVKVRGYRVEIEEVELALMELPQLREAAVVPLEEAATGSSRLVACVVSATGAPLDAGELRRFLGRRLPEYMIPGTFVPLAEMPHTLSGKIDRAAVRELAARGRQAPASDTAPQSGLEAALTRLFADLLQVAGVGAEESLLDLGAHSLLFATLQGRLRGELGVEVGLADLIRNPSARALTRFVAAGEAGVEITAGQLAAEAELPPEIRPAAALGAPAPLPAAVFLTGGTGFLGAHLLTELLERTRGPVFCLVRAADAEAGRQALRRAAEQYGLRQTGAEERIVPVVGDLARPHLGLAAGAFDELAAGVEAIYHCGANVNHLWPYEVLRAANAEATREVLRLTVQGRAKTLHHVSTLSVLEKAPYLQAEAAPEAPLEAGSAGLHGGYRQSKWVAERLVQAAIERGVRAVIYRPGWLTGSSRTGALNRADFLTRLAIGSLRAGMAPGLGPVESCPTPVDWAAAALAWLSLRPESAGRVFHLINPCPVDLERVLDWARELGHPLRRVPTSGWAAALADLGANGSELLKPLTEFLRQLASSAATAPQRYQPLRFASAETRAALAEGSIECPPPDRRLLEVYLSSFVELAAG